MAGITRPGYGAADPDTMRRFRRLAARAEKRGLVKVFGSLVFRPRHAVTALLPPAADVRVVRALCGKGRLRQGLDRLVLLLVLRFEPAAYYLFGLFDDARFARAGEFITQRQLTNVLEFLNRDLPVDKVHDKAAYAGLCRTLDVPAPEVLGTWTPHVLPEPDFAPDLGRMADAHGVILKPVRGHGGNGLVILRRHGDGTWFLHDNDGTRDGLDWAAVHRALAPTGETFVVQQLAAAHPDLAAFGGTALPAVRLVTLWGEDGPRPISACVRIGRDGAVADNFSQGGTAAGVDLETGVLRPGTRAATGDMPGAITHLGPANRPLAGLRLPHWDQVLDIGLRLHRACPEFLSLGHDIAITADGATALESNNTWAARTGQKALDSGLGATPLPAALLDQAAARRRDGAR
ncbi:MAG: hypothetical protein H6907_15340 [Hyphomicrobiales bacterium]|nr:hypothetical protein [Hyphomicrobiales bacterium]MCP5373099.1 hypothetical protein [Hyphomicrobiales bacterium]